MTKFYPDFVIPENLIYRDDVTPAALQAHIMDNIENPESVLEYCVESEHSLTLVNN